MTLRSLPVLALASLVASSGLAPASAGAPATKPSASTAPQMVDLCRPAHAGWAACAGVIWRPAGPQSTHAPSPKAITPLLIHRLYRIPYDSAIPQTVAIVDAYNSPGLESDLAVYDREYGLPSCTLANGCLSIVNQRGRPAPLSRPSPADDDWNAEVSMDVEAVHATCENCKIVVFEARNASLRDLSAAAATAKYRPGVTEISNSYGGPLPRSGRRLSAYDAPGVVEVAAAGDAPLGLSGSSPAEYPAADPDVVAVGATTIDGAHPGDRREETWAGSVAGCSPWRAPAFELAVTRAVPSLPCGADRIDNDISVDGDPRTGLSIYYSPTGSSPTSGEWAQAGGTSMAAPIVAAMFALAGGAQGMQYPAAILYHNYLSNPDDFGRVSGPTPGDCFNEALCAPNRVYSPSTGLGYPRSLAAFQNPYDDQRVSLVTDPNRRAARPLKSVWGHQIAVPLTSGSGTTEATVVNHPHRRQVSMYIGCADGALLGAAKRCLDEIAVQYTTVAGHFHARLIRGAFTVTGVGPTLGFSYGRLLGRHPRTISSFMLSVRQATVTRARNGTSVERAHSTYVVSSPLLRVSGPRQEYLLAANPSPDQDAGR